MCLLAQCIHKLDNIIRKISKWKLAKRIKYSQKYYYIEVKYPICIYHAHSALCSLLFCSFSDSIFWKGTRDKKYNKSQYRSLIFFLHLHKIGFSAIFLDSIFSANALIDFRSTGGSPWEYKEGNPLRPLKVICILNPFAIKL